VWRLERWLHLDIVSPLNDWLSGRGWLETAANYEYAFMYIATALGTIVWLLWRHPEAWPRARTSFVLVNLAGIACFWLYPVTPPRLLPGSPVTDTVTTGQTWGSWGSSVVSGANQLAAMPSLHFAWALWVSVALASVSASIRLQAVSALHVALTLLVIVATANHYVLDAVAAAVLVVLADQVARRVHDPAVVGSADAFFLHVERTGAPQTVGGLVLLGPIPGEPDGPSVTAVRDLVRGELPRLPRFTQRVTTSRWRRPRWVAAPDLDWEWHVPEVVVPDRAGMDRLVADLAEQPLPRDRPLWRFLVVRSPERSGVLLLMHHAVADGIGTVIQALNLLRPRIALPEPPDSPSPLAVAAGTALGLGQLAFDGGVSEPLGATGERRDFASDGIPLADLKATGHRVTDVLLAMTAGALADIGTPPQRLRIAVPLMVRAPGDGAEGNVTAAVMVDVPSRAAPTAELLAGLHTSRLRSPSRALASRFVMARLIRLLPEPLVGWFARTVYGRRFFHAIVSNMPGPDVPLTLAAAPMDAVYPVLPLAPDVPVVLGGLSWNGVLGLGLATAPESYDARAVLVAMRRRLAELREDAAPVSRAATSPARGGGAAAPAASRADRRTALGGGPDGS
jgi:diacylglycerol O-acyltransferase / wax synthase